MGSSKEDEKQMLVELVHAAKKAGEGTGEDYSRCLDALNRLKEFTVTVQSLVSTQVGKQLRPLTKHASKDIQKLASEIFRTWKSMFLEQSKKNVAKPSKNSDKLRILTPPPIKPQTPDRKLKSPALSHHSMVVPKCNDPTRDKC